MYELAHQPIGRKKTSFIALSKSGSWIGQFEIFEIIYFSEGVNVYKFARQTIAKAMTLSFVPMSHRLPYYTNVAEYGFFIWISIPDVEQIHSDVFIALFEIMYFPEVNSWLILFVFAHYCTKSHTRQLGTKARTLKFVTYVTKVTVLYKYYRTRIFFILYPIPDIEQISSFHYR